MTGRYRTRRVSVPQSTALVGSVLTLVAAAVLGTSSVSRASTPPAPFRDGVVLVSFRAGVSDAARRADVAAVRGHLRKAVGGGVRLMSVPRGHVLSAVKTLRRRASVRLAEPDYLMAESAVPNDPSFGLQWGDQNTGQVVNGVSGSPAADEKALAAWTVTTGTRSVVVAEVDSGVDYTHPDLAANIWSNPGGVGGCPAGTHGYNVLTSTCDPMDDETIDGGHGTHVAGIIGAVGNNGVGVTGVNWVTTILPVKWIDSGGRGATSDLITALNWVLAAKQAGVNIRVVNDAATYVGSAYSQALSDEIDLLGQNDILFVTAAGNTGDNNDDPAVRRYPCGYDRPAEICVTASDQRDALPPWAGYGASTVDLAAPGDNIYSTLRNGTYGYLSGGSMAAAQVSGAAALILAARDFSAEALKGDILSNVDPDSVLVGRVRTGGRLDICKALPGCTGLIGPPLGSATPVVSGTFVLGKKLSASSGSWSNTPSSYAFDWLRCGSSTCSPIADATRQTYRITVADVDRKLAVRVTATNALGSTSATSPRTPSVAPGPVALGSDDFSALHGRGIGSVRPGAISDGDDRSSRVTGIQWRTWGGSQAFGHGSATVLGPSRKYVSAGVDLWARTRRICPGFARLAYGQLLVRQSKRAGKPAGAWHLWAGAHDLCARKK